MISNIFTTEDPVLRAQIPKGIPLVVTMRGISDAGGVLSQLETYFNERCDPQRVIRFLPDELMDYRSRRPIITFDADHFDGYEPEELVLSLAHDEMGAPFLLLNGFEPDFRWEQFLDVMMQLVKEFSVSTVVWSHAIPMPVPHTRPIRMTVSGSRDDLIESYSVWKPTSKLPATAAHVLEYRLHQLGEEVVGFALLVPHYLANTEYPEALIAALEGFMAATGLLFSTDTARETAAAFLTQVNTQIAENDESLEMVRGLEQRYDEYIEHQTHEASRDDVVPFGIPDDAEGSVDQLVTELERFLAAEDGNDQGTGNQADTDPPNNVQ